MVEESHTCDIRARRNNTIINKKMDDFLRQLVSDSNGTVSLGGSTFREHVLGFAHAIKWDEVCNCVDTIVKKNNQQITL